MLAGTLFEDSEERASDTLTRAAFLMEAVAVGFDFGFCFRLVAMPSRLPGNIFFNCGFPLPVRVLPT